MHKCNVTSEDIFSMSMACSIAFRCSWVLNNGSRCSSEACPLGPNNRESTSPKTWSALTTWVLNPIRKQQSIHLIDCWLTKCGLESGVFFFLFSNPNLWTRELKGFRRRDEPSDAVELSVSDFKCYFATKSCSAKRVAVAKKSWRIIRKPGLRRTHLIFPVKDENWEFLDSLT